MNKLFIVFLLALFLRFLYFPENIYFGFDAARDAYAALDILKGDLKIIGPPTSAPGLYHGVLYYYVLAPLYLTGNLSPESVALLLRIFNALGVFLLFYSASILFDKRTGLLSALLFAVSFEQTQFSIYMGNPTLAVLSVPLMYTGFALVIFKQKSWGLPLAALSLGSSIQFQFALLYLLLPLILILIFFRKHFLKLPFKIWIISGAALLLSLSTFILGELKYNFRTLHAISSLSGSENQDNIFNTYTYMLFKMGQYNIVDEVFFGGGVLLFLIMAFIFILKDREYRPRLIFLGIWFFSIVTIVLISGGVSDLKSNTPLYYPNVGVSLALLIFVAFLISKLFNLNKVLGVAVLLLIMFANFRLIQTFNHKGTISEINVQQGMLLSDEKKVLDYMYNKSAGQMFAVKGVTMPYLINTTWSYLFEWYGQNKYGYTPIWNGRNAEGFPGNLKSEEAQEKLPNLRFLIIEPTRGIPPHLINEYLKEESYFTKVIEEKKVGQFIVQKRKKF